VSHANLTLDENTARRVLLVQAFDLGCVAGGLWTPQDRDWATRLTRETVPAGTPAGPLLAERAHHALQRLQPRHPPVAATLAQRRGGPVWLLAAALLGAAIGLLADAIGSSQRINLLAPPVWGVIVWNLLVVLGLLLPWPLALRWPQAPRRWLATLLAGRVGAGKAADGGLGAAAPLQAFQALWLQAAAPLLAARTALLLHVAALALALGLIASLYMRGLVLDYRAGWQSTFLEPAQVQVALRTLLAPATALTGIVVPGVPDLAALRTGPDAPATGPAGLWIHLYVAMLAAFVLLPRGLLALWAALRVAWLVRRLPLPGGTLYFQRLLHELRGDAGHVHLRPHGAPPTPAALAGAKVLLAGVLGDAVQLSAAAAVSYGNEDTPPPAPAGVTLQMLVADLAATPEDDTHGRFLQSLRRAAPGVPVVLLVDEAAFAARFATLPARLAERRAAWQRWAGAQDTRLLLANLSRPPEPATLAALQAVLMQ
jgi:hypothetical protein